MPPEVEKPANVIPRLEPTGLAKPSTTCGFLGTGMGLAPQEAEGRAFGRAWNRTELGFEFYTEPLAGYPDGLLTVIFSCPKQVRGSA